MIRSEAYVGISGIVTPDQQENFAEQWKQLEVRGKTLALGVKAVHNTQYLDRPNKYGSSWYPVAEEFSGALDGTLGTDTLHVAQMYLDPELAAADHHYPIAFTDKVRQRAVTWLDAVQYDMLPYADGDARWQRLLASVKQSAHYKTIVQCHAQAMAHGPAAAVEQLRYLAPHLNYVLFDASHGTGKELDVNTLLQFLETAYADNVLEDAGVNFGIAGGLNADRVRRHLPGVLAHFPAVSWDAEGQLHNPIGPKGDGKLNQMKVSEYLYASAQVLQR